MADRGVTTSERVSGVSTRLLWPYVPTLVADWLRDRPHQRHRQIDCTLVFADISGFTRLTELLGGLGKIGAEEMAGLINGAFEPLLEAAYAYGAGLIKWGGDATLLLFEGSGHATRGCRAAFEMQHVIRQRGRLQTSHGPLRLRMSIGVHSGRCDYFLVGREGHQELLVTGPGATTLTAMEKLAEAGQVVVSDGTADALARGRERRPGPAVGDGWLLRRAPAADPLPHRRDSAGYSDHDLGRALGRSLREHILAGAVESEHRHVATGFLRFAGVDQLLAEQGPEAVLDALDHVITSLQSAALRNEVAFLATDVGSDGGKVMLSAGAPRRIGRDEARMVATLRDALDAGGPLALSAGASSGRAFAGDYGPRYRRTYSLMGDCVNLAARLMAHAAPGELLVNEALFRALGRGFAAEQRPPFAAKGKSALVTPYSISSIVAGQRAIESGAAPLIGREADLAELLALAARAGEGGGSVIEVVGEPGMGKSRLLAEFEHRASAEVLWCEGDVYAATRAYAPFERLLRGVVGLPSEAEDALLSARLQAATQTRARQLVPWLPLIAIAAGLELDTTAEVDQTDESLRKERLEELTSELLGALLTRPTVLVFNDVHLMDDASRDLIQRLAADTPSRPWLLVASRRPDSQSPFGGLAVERLELAQLSDADAAQLLAIATEATPLPPHRLAALAARAGGNPLFLRELAAQLSDGTVLDSLPSSVEEVIAARIDRLDVGPRGALRAAAVLGIDVELPLLEEVLGPELDSAGAAADLQGWIEALSEFLEPMDATRRRFSHQLVREVAYDALPYGRRSELHARTAQAITRRAGKDADQHAELLSLHFLHGKQYGPAWRFSLIAAEHARSHYANAEAADFYGRALAAAERVPDLGARERAEVELALGDLYVDLGEVKDAEVAFRRGLGRVRELPLAAARYQLRLARLRNFRAQLDAALRWTARADRTLAGLDGDQADLLRGELAARRARISYTRGRHARALVHAGDAIELTRRTGDRVTLAGALELADMCAVELGRPTENRAEQALAIFEELGMLGDEARVRNTLGMLAYYSGDWPAAAEHYAQAERAYIRAGRFWDSAIPAGNAAEILADQGHLQEAQAAFERVLLVFRGCNADSDIAFAEYSLGRIAAHLGRHTEAMEHLEAARKLCQAAGELSALVRIDALTAEALWLAHDADGAIAQADQTLARAKRRGVLAVEPLLHRVRGAALLELGRPDEAELALRDALAAARQRDARHEIAYALRAMVDAELARDQREAVACRRELKTLTRTLGIEPEPVLERQRAVTQGSA